MRPVRDLQTGGLRVLWQAPKLENPHSFCDKFFVCASL
jgi:hypothetical protein